MGIALNFLRKYLPAFVKRWLIKILQVFIDQYTWVKPVPWFLLVRRTQQYRLASIGLPITQNETKILDLHNSHRGKRCFILGGGPSLNKCDLTLLKDEYTFGVNGIFLNYDRMSFNPSFYVVEDTLVAEDRAMQINDYKGPLKFFGNYLRYCINGDPSTIWLNVRVRYDEYPGFPNFSTNALRDVWVGGTVTYICLQLAFYFGFSEIYLIGFDHSYVIPTNVVKTKNGEIISQSDDENHFHHDYFGKGYRWHDPKVNRMEKAYAKAKLFFEADGRKIYDATIGGQLELFERVNYLKLFNS